MIIGIFFFALSMCFASQLNGKWEVKKLHHGLIYWENFGLFHKIIC